MITQQKNDSKWDGEGYDDDDEEEEDGIDNGDDDNERNLSLLGLKSLRQP